MTRRLSTTPHRRLLRARAEPRRFDHAGDLALLDRRDARLRPEPDERPRDRDSDRALQAVIEENAMLARELGRVQQRCSRWRDECIVQADRLEGALIRARADAIVKETQMASLRESLEALQKRAAVWLTNEELVRRLSDLRARNRSLESELVDARRAVEALRAAGDSPRATADDEPREAPAAALAHCRVLCVGGRARQVPVYREMVERGGGPSRTWTARVSTASPSSVSTWPTPTL